MTTLGPITVAGHVYYVQIDEANNIVATACERRWPMTNAATGDNWLDKELRRNVDFILSNGLRHNFTVDYNNRPRLVLVG